MDLGISILTASAATFANGNGVLVWPILLLIVLVLRLGLRILLTYVVSGACVIGLYLYHYVTPRGSSSPLQSLRHPLLILVYIAKYIGFALPPWVRLRSLVGTITGTFGLLAGLAVILWVLRRRRQPFPVALVSIMCFPVATAFVTALGRLSYGTDQAFQSRYQTFNLLFWFSLVTLWLLVVNERAPLVKTVTLASMAVAMLLAITQFPLVLRAPHLLILHEEAASLALVVGVPDKQALTVLYPDPQVPWRDADYLRSQHLFMFSQPQYGLLGGSIGSLPPVGSPELCDGRVDLLERLPRQDSLTELDSEGLRIAGWAVERSSGEPIRNLVIAADGKIVGLGTGGLLLRTSGSKAFLKNSRFVEWSGFVRPPPGTESLDVYALNDRRDELCHLATAALPSH